MIREDRELLCALQAVTEDVVQFVLGTVGAEPVSVVAQLALGRRMVTVGRALRDRAIDGAPINGYVNGIVENEAGSVVDAELALWADRLDDAVDEAASCQDRDNEGAARLLSAIAMLAESTRALARGDVSTSAAHADRANALLTDTTNIELRPGPDEGA